LLLECGLEDKRFTVPLFYKTQRAQKLEEHSPNAKRIYVKALAISAIYSLGGRRPMLRLGVQGRGLRAKLRYWLHHISIFDLRLLN
jgi:hypothetical protein